MRYASLERVESVKSDGATYAETERSLWDRFYRIDTQETAIRKESCGNENPVVNSDVEGDGGDILEGELAKVDLAGLAVGEGDAVVGDAGVLGAEAAHRHCLHTPGAAVVPHHHT